MPLPMRKGGPEGPPFHALTELRPGLRMPGPAGAATTNAGAWVAQCPGIVCDRERMSGRIRGDGHRVGVLRDAADGQGGVLERRLDRPESRDVCGRVRA